MNREVYAHYLQTYGRNPRQWVGFAAETIKVLIVRVYVVIVMAQITTSIASGDIDAAQRYTLIFFFAYVAAVTLGTLGELLSIRTENAEYKRLMVNFYQKLVNKDLSFYRDNQTGYLASVYRQYLDSMMLLNRFLRGEPLAMVISLVLPPIVLFVASPMVGLVALGVVIIQFGYVAWSSAKVNHYRKMSHEIYRKVTGEVSDIITNIVAFKAAGAENRAHDRMEDLAVEENDMFWLRRKMTALLDLPRSILTAFGVSAAIYFIISDSSATDPVALGLIVMTLTYMFQIVRNVAALPEMMMQHDDLITKVHPTLKYLGEEHEAVRDPEHPSHFVVTQGAIEIDNISFGYRSHAKGARVSVFEHLNISIRGGEQIGIVGLSGAGKSTLASLLLRFDDVDDGAIRIDGVDIRHIRQRELRRNIAYVPQEPLLFHRSVRENIAYYDSEKSSEDIVRAAKAAHAHEFIEKLPEGYDTMVGERGIKLSGGQKQRIAIARAVLKKAPIMIFDEATSALDSESEQIIQKALPEILGKQTAIVVAHRLSTVAGLDRIIVMHDGNIEESGTHEELLARKGRYYSLWQKQTTEFASNGSKSL